MPRAEIESKESKVVTPGGGGGREPRKERIGGTERHLILHMKFNLNCLLVETSTCGKMYSIQLDV